MATKAAAKMDRHQGKEYSWAARQVTLGSSLPNWALWTSSGIKRGMLVYRVPLCHLEKDAQTQPLPEPRAEQGK